MKLGTQEELAAAYASLDRGSAEEAKALAQAILTTALADGDAHLEAKALSCLAFADRLLSRFRDGLTAGSRAVQLFQCAGDLQGEAGALLTQAYCASVLGRNEEGVEAAMLAVELCRRSGDAAQLSIAHIYLGSTFLHSRSFDHARLAFADAMRIGLSHEPPLPEFHALVSLGCSETIRALVMRHESGSLPDLALLYATISRCEQFVDAGSDHPVAPGAQVSLYGLWWLLRAIGCCWKGDTQAASDHLRAARDWTQRYVSATWLDALSAIVESEVAQARGDWVGALAHARSAVSVGDKLEHEQVASWGQMIVCHLLVQQNQLGPALDEMCSLAARERRNRNDSMDARKAVVQWQLDMRRSEQSRVELAASARRLEKLSFEDALTGLPNRRDFETRARGLLEDAASNGRSISVALIDVDKFKQVNDGYSHATGDAVLKEVASQLRHHVREDDIAARLAGDEFVLALRRTDQNAATEACERIRQAVGRFDWNSIAPGLSVTISIGVTQSKDGDALEDVMARADAAMYSSKRAASTEREDSVTSS